MEYKIISGDPADCQMVLNQWRHKYTLNIISMCTYHEYIAILLTRTEKFK